jgi:glutathione S-transferase
MRYALVIGDKATSSWSLRPWLAMRHAGLAFREIAIRLDRPQTREEILHYSPSGRVPVLLVGDHHPDGQVVWESLAILEFLAEAHPEARLWPSSAPARAHARALAAEMHAGFAALRQHCPMDLLARRPMAALPDAVAQDVRRIIALVRGCREVHGVGGDFLFGAFGAADAMYAPVAARFSTYLADLAPYGDDGAVAEYVGAILALPAMAAWTAGARREAERS